MKAIFHKDLWKEKVRENSRLMPKKPISLMHNSASKSLSSMLDLDINKAEALK